MKKQIEFRLLLQNFLKPENIFLSLGLIFGLLFLFITPPFQVPDEPNHFYRAYQISEGGILPQKLDGKVGGFIPSSLLEVEKKFNDIPFHVNTKTSINIIVSQVSVPLNSAKTTFASFPNTSLYSPVSYLPQVAGILLGRLLNLSPIIIFYLARLFALAAWLALLYTAIKLTPIGKWAFVAISFTPMLIFLVPSISADSFMFGLTALVVSLSLKYAHQRDLLQRKDYISIIVLAVILSLIKVPYSFAFLIFLIVPPSKFKNLKQYFKFWFITLLVFVALVAAWYIAMQHFYVPGRPDIFVSPQVQLTAIRENPKIFVKALYDTYFVNQQWSQGIFFSFIGVLGWLDTSLPTWLILLVVINLILGFLSIETNEENPGLLSWLITVGLPAGMFLIINLLIYLSWTSIGNTLIDGIQGRYFLPLALLAIPLLASRKYFSMSIKGNRSALYFSIIQLIILIATLSCVVGRFY